MPLHNLFQMTFTPAKRRKSREEKLKTFDADKNGKIFDGLFGLPFNTEDSELVILPVPWDITSSNHGSSTAPEAILEASKKISLFREDNENVWENGIALHKIPKKWQESSQELIKISRKIKRNNNGSINKQNPSQLIELYRNVNYSNIILKEWVFAWKDFSRHIKQWFTQKTESTTQIWITKTGNILWHPENRKNTNN